MSPAAACPPPSALAVVPRLFGTDGIRGVANVELKPTLAYALGRATAHRLVGPGGALVVGQDTRRSGDMFVSAITSGATSLGVDVHVAGCLPTPALAFLAGTGDFAAGIMVSASHNPADDNGLKVLDAYGPEARRRRRGRARAADLADRGAGSASATPRSAGRSSTRALLERYRRAPPRPGARRRRAAACGSSSTAPTAPAESSGRRSSPRPARPSRSSTTSQTA